MDNFSLYPLLHQILIEAGMVRIRTESSELLVYYLKEDKPHYLLIYPIEQNGSPEQFLNIQRELYLSLNTYLEDEEFGKNASCLLCVPTLPSQKDNVYLNQAILRAEEDPYYFKKFVLVYDLNSVNQILMECGLHKVLEYITNLCFDADRFDFYINHGDPLYCLASQLLIKLPFISLKLNTIEPPKKILEAVEPIALQKGLSSLRQHICKIKYEDFTSWSSKNFSSFDEQMQALDLLLDSWPD